MKFETKSSFLPAHPQECSADPILTFVSANYEGLWHAARLLGGYEAARLVDRCRERLMADGVPTSCARLMLGQILAILSLEMVGDPESSYTAHFAAIDPLDPVVEEICLLTDGLCDVLEHADHRKARSTSVRAA